MGCKGEGVDADRQTPVRCQAVRSLNVSGRSRTVHPETVTTVDTSDEYSESCRHQGYDVNLAFTAVSPGRRYAATQRQTRSGDAPGSTPTEAPRTCQNCVSHVTRKFRRIFGDRENVAHQCYDCDSNTRLYQGRAAGKDVERADPRNRDRQSTDYDPDWRNGIPVSGQSK
jgi:hypothetical protein